MNMLVIVSDEVHRSALREARRLGRDLTLPADLLHAPLDDEANTWIERIWDAAEGAINHAYHEGLDAARPLIEKASGLLREMVTLFAKRAAEVRAVVSERLNLYLLNTIDGALKRTRSSLSVGGIDLQLQRVTVKQRLSMSGSLKASLEEICEFVAEGEISLSAEYHAPD